MEDAGETASFHLPVGCLLQKESTAVERMVRYLTQTSSEHDTCSMVTEPGRFTRARHTPEDCQPSSYRCGNSALRSMTNLISAGLQTQLLCNTNKNDKQENERGEIYPCADDMHRPVQGKYNSQ